MQHIIRIGGRKASGPQENVQRQGKAKIQSLSSLGSFLVLVSLGEALVNER